MVVVIIIGYVCCAVGFELDVRDVILDYLPEHEKMVCVNLRDF